VLVYLLNHSTAPVNLGGAERSLLDLVEDWYATDSEFEAVFITKAPRGRFIAALEERGWSYRGFRYRGWAGPTTLSAAERRYFARDDYAATLAMIRMMEDRRPDLVITNTVVAPWAAFAAAAVGVPHAWFIREYGDLDHGLTFANGRAATFADVGLLSQAVFTNSHALRAHVGQYLDPSAVTVVYPRLDAHAIAARATEPPAVPPFPHPEPGLRIVVVGRLSQSKGQWRVIEALGALHARGTAASVCLVGSDETAGTEAALRARATELGVADRLTMVGEQANPYPFIAAADVAITPSTIEAFGRATLEYMIVGKPVIATDGGGSAELIEHGVTGQLVSADDPPALVNAIARYAADPNLVAAHGSAGLARSATVLTEETSNAAAIARLRRTATEQPYRLPAVARSWFELPAGGSSGVLTVVARRLPARLRTALRRIARR
jgi:glycosyltransferase involved in cell wall biosynthesis